MTDKNRVYIFDTTMRDGEQSPGASMSLEEKIQIAHSALEFIKPDISIAINDGTTNYYFAKLLLNLSIFYHF